MTLASSSDEQQDHLARVFGALTLADLLKPIPERAERWALETDQVGTLTQRGLADATRDWETRERILTLRHVRDSSTASDKDLAGEREVARLLSDAILRPLARWTGACLLIRTSSPLSR